MLGSVDTYCYAAEIRAGQPYSALSVSSLQSASCPDAIQELTDISLFLSLRLW